MENENGKIGEMEKKGMEKCGWTAGEMFSIIRWNRDRMDRKRREESAIKDRIKEKQNEKSEGMERVVLTRLHLSASALKYLALLAMTADHIAVICRPVPGFRTFGDLAFPLFAFLLVEGFFHTRDRRCYGRRLLLAAVVSEIPYDLAFSGRWMDAQHQNVCLTFFLALVAMELLERYGNGIWEKLVLTAVFCTLTEAAGADGGAWGMGMVLAFYFCVIGNSLEFPITQKGTNVPRNILFHEKTAGVFMKIIVAVLIGAFAWQEPLWVLALTAVCFMLYDGSRGRSRFRSFFYVYYPAHLLTLYFVGKWLG